jgi:hypothetical protein
MITLNTTSLWAIEDEETEFDHEKFQTELKESADYFSFGMNSEDVEAAAHKKSLVKKREANIPEVKKDEFADLESTYFDTISTKASAVDKQKKKSNKLKRER